MNDIVLVGDKFLTNLFRFAGVDVIEEGNDEMAAQKIQELVAEERYRMMIVTQSVALRLTELRKNLLATHKLYPVFIVIPGPSGSLGEREDQLKQLVSQSLGIKLKFGD